MKKIAGLSLAAAVFAALALMTAAYANDDDAAKTEGGDYTVIKGDTLWDISGEKMQDPFSWPRIWEKNPQIKNPDLIYPGDRISLPGAKPAEKAAQAAQGEKAEGASGMEGTGTAGEAAAVEKTAPGDEEPFVYMGESILRVPEEQKGKVILLDEEKRVKSPIATESMILTSGFVSEEDLDDIQIIGSPLGDRRVFSLTDEVFIHQRDDVKKGDRLLMYRYGEDVDDPGSGDDMGVMVVVSGVARVTGTKDEFQVCEIESAFSEIRNNDLMTRFDTPELVYEPVPKNPALKGEWGYVVETGTDELETYASLADVVYIGMGYDDGVRPGDRFVVRRSGGSTSIWEDDQYLLPSLQEYVLPDVEVGEVQVISAQGHTATAVIVSDNETIHPGFRVYYKD